LIVIDAIQWHLFLREIEAMGMQIEIIPGGCTGMCQPIDVGVGKPLKTRRARHLWEERMLSECDAGNPLRSALRMQMS
jgi:hypothetical protein